MEINSINRILPVVADQVLATQERVDSIRGVIQGIQAINKAEYLGNDRELAFQFDEEAHRVLIQIKDRQSGEILQQIPLKQILEMIKNLRLQQRGKGRP